MYVLSRPIHYHSSRYNRDISVPAGYVSDGATGAVDIASDAWWVHDWMVGQYQGDGPRPDRRWNSGECVSAWQSSMVLHDILLRDGYWFRAWYWLLPAFVWVWIDDKVH